MNLRPEQVEIAQLRQFENGPGFTVDAFNRNRTFASLQLSDPALHKFAQGILQQERDDLVVKQPLGVQTAIRIWVITGALEFGLSLELL